MRIVSSELREHAGPVAPLASARGIVRARAGLLLRVRDELGNVGLGEASPLPGYSSDSLAAARTALAAVRFPPLAPSQPVLPQLAAVSASIDSPAARFAAETALLDLFGQRLGRPAHALLGRRAGQVALSAMLGPDLVGDARRARARGIRTVKIKIGLTDFATELAALSVLRRAEPDLALRVDANGAYALEDAPRILAALAELRTELCEEPIADGFLSELTASPVAIAADESLQGPWPAVEPALRAGVVRALVLKPMALGGFVRCLELAARARALGAGVIVTHLWDGPVGLAAAAALALAVPGVLASGLDRHPGLGAWPRLALPFLADDAVLATDRPGLGLELP